MIAFTTPALSATGTTTIDAATVKAGGGKAPVHACTQFRLLWRAADGSTSVVECRPQTGRTHQIRVHLQVGVRLGCPYRLERVHKRGATLAMGVAAGIRLEV